MPISQLFSAGSNQDDYKIRLALEASPNGMVLIDRDGRIVLVNSSLESLFGYGREELIGQTIELLVPSRFRDAHPQQRGAYQKRPIARAMASGFELYGMHKDGHEIPLEIGLNPIEANGESFVIASVVDITERKRARGMMQLAVEAAPNGMVMTDAKGVIILVNKAVEKMFGYSRDELIGQRVSVLVPERFRNNHENLRVDYFGNPVSRAMGKGRDLYAMSKSGLEIPVEIGLNPISTSEGTVILASVVDITERKEREEQLRKAVKEKEILLAEIHHRVKNNLQIIDSLLGMQLDTISSSKEITALVESQNRVKSMAFIHQALYQSSDLSRVNMATIVNNLRDNLIMSYGADSIDITTEVDAITLPIDNSIPLSLIINELISNALKHAFREVGTGRVHLQLLSLDNGKIKLSVSDNGCGVAEAITFDNATSLGLRLISALTEQLGGEITAFERLPTRFEFLFPCEDD